MFRLQPQQSLFARALRFCLLYGTLSLTCSWSRSRVIARLVNVTVDDAGADPFTNQQIVYHPDVWIQGSNCTGCWAKPNPPQTHNGTWHDATYDPISPNIIKQVPQTAFFNFTGTSRSWLMKTILS